MLHVPAHHISTEKPGQCSPLPSHIPSCTPPNTVQLQLEAAYLMYDVGDRDLGFAHWYGA